MNSSSDSATSPRQRAWRTAAGTVLLIVVVALLWWLGSESAPDQAAPAASPSVAQSAGQAAVTTETSSPSRSTGAAPATKRSGAPTRSPAAQAPERVLRTLALIDAGRWPEAANAAGTQGGRTFRNNEGLLPRTGADGRRLRFQEWDVNPKQPGRGRDAERIVTADDGSAWYTLDHYRSFIRIRGPGR